MSWARLANRPNNGSYAPKQRNQTITTTYNDQPQSQQLQQPMVQITNSKKKHNDIHTIVLDSGAFIGRQSFFNNFDSSTQYYMTPAVNNEIRDKQSRAFLNQFPYQIHIKKPDSQSMRYVSRFLQKHPNLQSLSKVDRQVVALAHTLELQYEGDKNLRNIDELKKNKTLNPSASATKKLNYAQSESGVAQQRKVKKSKSGRVHTTLQAMPDTGVRLAVMKKVVPFHFDDFMTMSDQQYGEKYGKPTQLDIMGGGLHSPARTSTAIKMDVDEEKVVETKKENESKTTSIQKKDDDEEEKANKSIPASPTSKAQKRRMRKKNVAAKKKELKQVESQSVNDIEVMAADRESLDHNVNVMDHMSLDDVTVTVTDNNNNIKHLEVKSEADAQSEIDKMIEHDLNTTFSETASLIESISEKNYAQMKQYNEMTARLSNPHSFSGPYVPPEQQQQQQQQPSLRPAVSFGTLFTGKPGSLFDQNQPLQSLPQQQTINQPVQTLPHQRVNANDAWKGDWLTPANYKPVKKTQTKQKQKVKNVPNAKNKQSAVCAITIDLAIQRCMIEMGLRVLSTTTSRQIGNRGGGGRNNNNRNNNSNNEPVQYIFRCFGCYQFEHNTNRVHCRWCGGQTFQRVAVYIDENGKSHYRYYYRDRFGYKYLEKHSLVPRGSQLIKNKGSNSNNHQNWQRNYRGGHKQKRRQKKRAYLGGGNGYNSRRNNGGGRW